MMKIGSGWLLVILMNNSQCTMHNEEDLFSFENLREIPKLNFARSFQNFLPRQ